MAAVFFFPLVFLCCCVGAEFSGNYFQGSGDDDYIEYLDIAARMMLSADPEYQSIPMLYNGEWYGLLEGPTWDAWWTQNSYGTVMGAAPYLPQPLLSALLESNSWWFNNMANGTIGPFYGNQGWAPDGCLCDDGGPSYCRYKQGDGNVPIHDWTLEETLSAIVMQAELLLVTRNMTAIMEYLPLFLRTSNLLESRRDTTVNMFLTGPSTNLLAPSFAGWKLDNGRYAWAYMAGISVTYTAALNRLIELETLAGRAYYVSLYTQRRDLTLAGLNNFYDPTQKYFVRSIDPNGTVHGVLGAPMHGYFEASPNHDAMAWRVVDDAHAQAIYEFIVSLGKNIRPYSFVIPNYPSYDDMEGSPPYTGLWEYGEWVNGGAWTTCEARMVMGYYRVSAYDDCFNSMNAILQFANKWRMDNPLTDFGSNVYQPDEPINLTVDAFGSPAAFVRGLFEYLYSATSLMLVPHIPSNITSLVQNVGVRFGAYMIFLDTTGSSNDPISQVLLNGNPITSFNSSTVTLVYDELPLPTNLSVLAMTNQIYASTTRLNVSITFGSSTLSEADSIPKQKTNSAPRRSRTQVFVEDSAMQAAFNCTLPSDIAAIVSNVTLFQQRLVASNLTETYVYLHSQMVLSFPEAYGSRCNMLNNGTILPLSPSSSESAADQSYLSTTTQWFEGLGNILVLNYFSSTDPVASQIWQLWVSDS